MIDHGTVLLVMKLADGRKEPKKLLETLHVPDLSFNLVSVSKVSESWSNMRFVETGCKFMTCRIRCWPRQPSVVVCLF